MKRLHILFVLTMVLVMLPGGSATAAALSAVSDSPTLLALDQGWRPTTTNTVAAAVEPTNTTEKFGTSFVVTGLPQGQRAQAAALATEAGLKWAREDMHWNFIETTPGTYNFSDRDNVVNALVAQNIQIIGSIVYTPQFYSSNPGAANHIIYPPTSPAALDAYAAFVTATVNRYKDRIHYWQVWGSIEDPSVYGPQPGLTEYLAMVARAHAAIKAADPTATIIMANSRPYLTSQFIDAGGSNYVDIFSISNYSIFDTPTSPVTPIPETSRLINWRVALGRDMVRRKAPSKALWVTEYDWASVPPARPPINEEDQAAYLIRSLLLQESQGNIGRVLWSFFTDNDNIGVINFGMLVRLNLAKKASFSAYQAMVTALSGASFSEWKASPSTSTQVLENFEGAQIYQANSFGTASAIFAKTTETAHSGTQSAKITYSWTSANASGVNVQPVPTNALAVTGSPSRFKVWAKGDGGPGVAVGFSFTDATNRFCNGLVGIVAGTEWREYTLNLDPPIDAAGGKTTLVTCGLQDGIIPNYPITFNGIAISGTEDAAPSAAGTVYLDDLTFESGPSIFDLVYNSPTNTIHAIWSLQGTPTFSLLTNAPSVTVRDWLNNTTTVNTVNGVASIPTSYHPVFVTLPLAAPPCSDRPRVSVTTARGAPGSLVATISAGTSSSLLSNQLISVQVGAATNASIDFGSRTNSPGNFTETFATGTTATSFTFRRASGVGSVNIPLVVTDQCGTWRTFVGGGPSAF